MLKMIIACVMIAMYTLPSFAQDKDKEFILTPKPSATPRINGAKVFGVRPGRPFLFAIAATGEKPITFTAEGLPKGLQLNKDNGRITGSLAAPGIYNVMLKATNKKGSNQRAFRIHVGNRLALTPPMGWNSYNVYGTGHINQQLMQNAAKAIVTSGLADHGWNYFNLDGGWQGYKRGGKYNAILPDSTVFPDFKGLVDYIHGLGLKFGLYHQAYINSYDKRIGATSNNPAGAYERSEELHPPLGKYRFHWNEAQQFADWEVDFLKYDWWKRDLQHAIEMSDALKNLNRDIIYSVCNGAGFTNGYNLEYPEATDHATALSYISELWRSGSDTENSWGSVIANGFTQDRWRHLTGPGHWNDPDMMLLGWVGWGEKQHPTALTPDEQYSHMSLWCLLAAPLLLGCDLTKLDEFTLSLLTNDEVIDVDQDPLGKQGKQIQLGAYSIAVVKELEDGSIAVGFFNMSNKKEKIEYRLADIGIQGKQQIRDLWRQKDLGEFENLFPAEVNSHGVVFVKLTPVKK